jgi:hypothetical protein
MRSPTTDDDMEEEKTSKGHQRSGK